MILRANPPTAASDRPLLRTFIRLLTRTTSATSSRAQSRSQRPWCPALAQGRGGRGLSRRLSALLAALSGLQLRYPFYQPGQEASVLPKLLSANVELLLEVRHLIL